MELKKSGRRKKREKQTDKGFVEDGGEKNDAMLFGLGA